jgi:hypothetical protein
MVNVAKIKGELHKTAQWLKTYQKTMAKKIKRYAWTSLLMAEYNVFRGQGIGEGTIIKPEIIVAGIPVWHINRLGHASSDEILKYRSMGGIFLAHQKGGKDTFKFTARIFGPMRLITYKLLEGLQLLGTEESGKVKDLVELEKISWADDKKNLIEAKDMKAAGSLGSPIIDFTKSGNFNVEEYGYHRTFPIITETKIYTDMYLETLVMRESVKLGKDCMEIECAFRQYIAPTSYQETDTNKQTERQYYTIFIPDKMIKLFRSLDLMINIGWTTQQVFNDFIGQSSPDVIYQKPDGKFTFEGTILLGSMMGHIITSSVTKYV